VGDVGLTAADPPMMRDFYERAIGLRATDADGGVVILRAPDDTALVRLEPRLGAPAAPSRATGLFHLALLVPTRRDLAVALRRVLDAGWGFTGAADHLVSEALYLDDPEGNGIELYRDRPRSDWTVADGRVRMATLALDVTSLAAEAPPHTPDRGMREGTRMGHVHLKVGDIAATRAVYADALGLSVTSDDMPGAVFMGAGGYHHHVGANVWMSADGPAPPPGARGLSSARLLLDGPAEVAAATARLEAEGLRVDREGDGAVLTDPSGIRMRLTPAAA
jgi:catechol 2,3-dioxygenase